MTSGKSATLPLILLSLLIGMCVVAGILLVVDEPDGGHGLVHATYPSTMLEGGSGVERLGSVRWLGLVFGLCQVGIFVVCLLLGMRRSPARTIAISIIGLVYAAAFTLLVVVDQAYAQGDFQAIVGGLPWPTAIMIYAVGGIPTLFVLLYTLFFDSWILTSSDLSRIEELVRRNREQQESGV